MIYCKIAKRVNRSHCSTSINREEMSIATDPSTEAATFGQLISHLSSIIYFIDVNTRIIQI